MKGTLDTQALYEHFEYNDRLRQEAHKLSDAAKIIQVTIFLYYT